MLKRNLSTNWKLVNLEDVIFPRKEKVQPTELNGELYLGLEHIISNNLKILNFGTSNDLKSTKGVFYPDDILYGKLRPYLNKVILADQKGVCSTDIIVFQVKKELVLVKYIANILRSNSFVSFATMKMSGANLPRVSWSKLKKFKIPIPPLKTQQKIVEILEKAEKLK
ncbi:MAG: restriction endonuclease subunit S, partial [Methanobacterium paludis]|nr:restriction endonuclease subunit S [Methanobacterium paludis]